MVNIFIFRTTSAKIPSLNAPVKFKSRSNHRSSHQQSNTMSPLIANDSREHHTTLQRGPVIVWSPLQIILATHFMMSYLTNYTCIYINTTVGYVLIYLFSVRMNETLVRTIQISELAIARDRIALCYWLMFLYVSLWPILSVLQKTNLGIN